MYILFNAARVSQRVSWPKPSSGTAHLVSAGIHVVPNESHYFVSSVNIVFEDSRGAQVGYTGALCILLSTQHSTAPVP